MSVLNVLYTCDDNYAPFAGVSMCSLFENNRDIDVRVFVIVDRVSDANIARFYEQAQAYGREVVVKTAEDVVATMESLGLPPYRNSNAANLRMMFDYVITEDVENLLYMDCDTLVVGSLAPLLKLDMQDKIAGVVRDALSFRYETLIGMGEEDKYFNSGMLYINVKLWKQENVSGQLLHSIKEKRNKYCNPDQDLLNIILRDRTHLLPPEYNFQPIHRMYTEKQYFSVCHPVNYYTAQQLENARANPVILHCYRVLGVFPWHEKNMHPDAPLFDEYVQKSFWKDLQKRPAPGGVTFAVERVLHRVLPKKMFLKIFESITYRNFKKQDKKLKKQS